MEHTFIREELKSNLSLFARFYLTLKAHKLKPGQMVDHLKSRPIVSCPGSLLHGLGVLVDRKLQEIVQRGHHRMTDCSTLYICVSLLWKTPQ